MNTLPLDLEFIDEASYYDWDDAERDEEDEHADN